MMRSGFRAVVGQQRFPGLAAAAIAVAVAFTISRLFPTISPLTVAVLLGVVAGNVGVSLRQLRPGLRFAVRHLLRVGVILLGLRLAVPDVLALGGPALAVVVSIVVITFSAPNGWAG